MSKTRDLLQMCVDRKLEKPEIRVWCHPRKIGKRGDDYYQLFRCRSMSPDSIARSLAAAKTFIIRHEEAEGEPVVAYDGYEFTEQTFWQYFCSKDVCVRTNNDN